MMIFIKEDECSDIYGRMRLFHASFLKRDYIAKELLIKTISDIIGVVMVRNRDIVIL